MIGLITGIVNNSNLAGELGQKLASYGNISIISNKTPAQSGPLQGVSIADIPQILMSYGEDKNSSNNYYEEIEEDYSFLAVQVKDNEIDNVKKLFSDWGANDIQYFYK